MATSKIQGNNDTGWKNVGGTWAGATRIYRVKNGICYVSCITFNATSSPQIPAGTWTVLGTLPEGARPIATVYGIVANRNGVSGETQINADGTINVITSAATKNIVVNVAFPVG